MNTAPASGGTPADGQAAGGAATGWAPALTLPQGGGAIRGVGETFSTNPVNGTAAVTIPVTTSSGRSGFGPQLSLSYDSGAGNGPFGLGWSLSGPSISRKTDRGLPTYVDGEGTAADADTFVLAGAEDLVPALGADGAIVERVRDGYRVRRYRPRVEDAFARIERWTSLSEPADVFWRTISSANVTTVLGRDKLSRVTDPADPRRTFTWLVSYVCDDRGNAAVYSYVPEDDRQVPADRVSEAGRSRGAGRYLKRVRYGNRTPVPGGWVRDPGTLPDDTWMFEVVLDYGEGHLAELAADPDQREFVRATAVPPLPASWAARPDPFSTYRPGFELRTHRLCRRVLMFHRFPRELGRADYLVRSTELTYREDPVASKLTRVTHAGYRAHPSPDVPDRYLRVPMPPVDLSYSQVPDEAELVTRESRTVDSEVYLPGLDEAGSHWLDLDGDGVAGVLTEQGSAWYYLRNLSPLTGDADPPRAAGFAAPELIAPRPAAALRNPGTRWLDLAGDGRTDLLVLDGAASGFYERTGDAAWEAFRAFPSWPTVDLDDPNVRLIDLSGDGRADILVSEGETFTWYPSLGKDGFGPPIRVPAVSDEHGPRLIFAEAAQTVFLADMSGDGLTDLVRIGNGEVCYWPNLGYGRFGAKLTMDGAPWFDQPDRLDPARLLLADADGSGTTDLIYLAQDGPRLHYNQAGNGWSAGHRLAGVPRISGPAAVRVLDLLGTGTACLVWSSPLQAEAGDRMRYLDLMGTKPHLLTGMVNNMGTETVIRYASSTTFALRDEREGRPWATRLPFPVHVVERVETVDRISGNRFVNRYAYHHGHYDGEEHEFRGFGMVEQWDSVTMPTLGGPATNLDAASHLPPALTRTWYHTGAFTEGPGVSAAYVREYYREGDSSEGEPGLTDTELGAQRLPDTVLPATLLSPEGRTPVTLTAREAREACRALKGVLLRQEIYAQDGGDAEDRPYTVSERAYTVELHQRQVGDGAAVHSVHPREQIDLHYERALVQAAGRRRADPRMTHTVTLATDAFGNVLRTVAIAYRRRELPGVDLPEQRATQVMLRATRVVNRPDEDDWYRTGLPVEARTFEVVGAPEPSIVDTRVVPYGFDTLARLVDDLFPPGLPAPDPGRLWPHEQWDWRAGPALTRPRLRPLAQTRTVYRRDDLTGPLALGDVESLALPHESYSLALADALVASVYRRTPAGQPSTPLLPDPALLTGRGGDEGGYVAMDSGWWVPSGRLFYSDGAEGADPAAAAAAELEQARAHFFLPRRFVDAFGQSTRVGYDDTDLLPLTTRDAVGQTWTAANDYCVLQPHQLTDPNGNRSVVAFDTLGMITATAVQDKSGRTAGDDVVGLETDPPVAVLQNLTADPHAAAAALLGQATVRTVYDLHRYRRCGQPPVALSLSRLIHAADPGGTTTPILISLTFSDGFGREIQRKVQAEPGPAPLRASRTVIPSGDAQPGPLQRDADGTPVLGAVTRRWVGTGRTIYNNKAKPVRHYEPFFSATPLYEAEPDLTETGVSPVLFYDPLARVVATLHPNHTYSKVVFDPWQQTTHDANDTVTDDPRTDPDVAGTMAAYFAVQPPGWRTWHDRRIGGQLGADEQDAARKAAPHAHTPGTVAVDPAGRAIRTLTRNRYDRGGATVEETVETRNVIDGAGLQRAVLDGLGRTVMRYAYDVLGTRIHQAGADSGERWLLNDVSGRPIRAWDSRGHVFRSDHDVLRRPVRHYVLGTDPTASHREVLVERTVYGDSPETGLTRAQARELNLLTHVYQHFDGAGAVTNGGRDPVTGRDEAFDFKGNRLRSTRRLVTAYATQPDWGATTPPALDEPMTTAITVNAVNSATSCTAPDGSVVIPEYNAANLLDRLGVRQPGAATVTAYVSDIDYDARGRRVAINYGNGAVTRHEYDPVTARLSRQRTTRPGGLDALGTMIFTDPTVVQDLHYTYDPVGDITRCADTAPATVFHDNRRVESVSDYTYDAVYRLIAATGREQVAQSALDPAPPAGDGRRDVPFTGARAHPNDLRALRSYAERYTYDTIGNITALRHSAGTMAWAREYTYAEASLIEAGQLGNRLTRTAVGGFTETYGYADSAGQDAEGAMTSVNAMTMHSDHARQLRRVDLGGGGTAYYVYDASGQRVRKVIERNGTPRSERVYAGGFERYREFTADAAVRLERTTMHVMDGKQRVALVETQTVEAGTPVPVPDAVIRYQLGNHLASATLELDALARVLSYEEYHPFGTTSFQVGPAGAEASLKRYRFTGKERDEETGFAYHGARYYAAWLGRWTSADPIGIGDGVNVYAYVHNQPVTCSDPSGQQGWGKVETEDSNAQYYYHADAGLTIRRSAQMDEVWADVGPHQADRIMMKFNPNEADTITVNKPITLERVTKDISTMSPDEFQTKYGVGTIDYGVLAGALIPPPEPIVIPEDKTLYMGNGGRIGTAEQLDKSDLADRVANLQEPTVVGSLYGVAAVALGADAKESSRMINLGNQLDGVVMGGLAVGAGLGARRGGADGTKRAQPPKNPGEGKVHLPIVNPHFADHAPEAKFQQATVRVADRLRSNPATIPSHLTPGENRLSSLGPWAQRIVFGNAVERALANAVAPTGLLLHTGDIRPAPRGGPDFTGAPGTPYEGLQFQVTSERGYWTHVEKAAPETIWGLYPAYTP
ncbi:hypothetical protein OG369_37480 [Streptomyces sp. NBC_01221]|uniref:SpvB/TcaC N-terminal domain-containing protein n=1 Tax=Streptomyces sp. NBC_01221 TaxID=2903782 RepID=UPI0022581BAB|nr:SpvB/TcaC N-terminal domain-containing protein [Streptomyces sp. NBC_01221]MCX4791589.1 hypothetical protein [Streptomyces sp. NBC_01221]